MKNKTWLFGLAFLCFGIAHAEQQPTTNAPSQPKQGTYKRETYREITPNGGPSVATGADIFITANFIWWKATQDTLNYAISGVATASTLSQLSPSGITGRGHVRDPDFGWEPGFKVGLGLNFHHDGWDLYGQYTWLHSNQDSKSTGIGINNTVTGIVTDVTALGDVIRQADWDLHFNVIDLVLGRNFYISQFLKLRPYFGFKGTWQDQELKVTTTADTFIALNQTLPGPYRMKQEHDTWGLGIRAGLDTAWHFTTNWSIFGDVAWSTMWTRYEVERRDRFTLATNPTSDYTYVETKINNYRVKYVGELEIGVRFELWLYDDNYYFAIQAGWEEQVWINYGNFIRLSNDVQGDLTLHGLNLKFRFDF